MNTEDPQARYYAGVKMIRYDLIKEFVLAFLVVSLVVVGLAGIFSSPDDPAVTIQNPGPSSRRKAMSASE